MGYRIAVDIGGTFTDLVGLDEGTGNLVLMKVSTTPEDFTQGVVNCLKRISIPMENVSYFVHGTTVIINMILQRKGVKPHFLQQRDSETLLKYRGAIGLMYRITPTGNQSHLCLDI